MVGGARHYLVGLGGHARQVIDAFRTRGVAIRRGYDDDGDVRIVDGVARWGSISDIGKLPDGALRRLFHCCIGSNVARWKVVNECSPWRLEWVRCIHASATVSSNARLGTGVYVGANASVSGGASIGDFSFVNDGAVVTHDVHVGNFSHVGPNCTLLGNVHVGDMCLIGGGAVVIPNVHVGNGATVGAGAVVTRDVLPHTRVAGNPARAIS